MPLPSQLHRPLPHPRQPPNVWHKSKNLLARWWKKKTDANSILDACMGTIQGQVNACASNDYGCLCTQYGNLLTCYDNCPMDIGATTVKQQRDQNCNAASVYGTTSTTYGTASATSAASSATSTSDSEAAVQTGFASGTSSGGSAAAVETGSSGAESVKAAGSLLALIFAGAAALL